MTLRDALKHFGSRAQIARALGVSRQSITRWQHGIPLRRQYELEDITGGKLKRAARKTARKTGQR